MKKVAIIFLMVAMLLNVSACSGKEEVGSIKSDNDSNIAGENNSEQKSEDDLESLETDQELEEQPFINIEDIDWSVEEETIDGQKVISFGYINNTNFTIADVEMKFVQKADVTKEQLSAFDNLKQDGNWSDDEIAEIYLLGYNRKLVDPGESVGESPCVINGTYTLVENMDQYQLMRPDSVSVAYIADNDKMYMIYYDFNTNKYEESTVGAKEIQEWSNSEISSSIPRPQFRVVMVREDNNDKFSFSGFGVSREEYNAYIETCKNEEFTDIQFEGDNSFRALNDDGYEINISYNAIEESVSAGIEQSSDDVSFE